MVSLKGILKDSVVKLKGLVDMLPMGSNTDIGMINYEGLGLKPGFNWIFLCHNPYI